MNIEKTGVAPREKCRHGGLWESRRFYSRVERGGGREREEGRERDGSIRF